MIQTLSDVLLRFTSSEGNHSIFSLDVHQVRRIKIYFKVPALILLTELINDVANMFNLISSGRAVSVFPRSTFVSGKFAASTQTKCESTSLADILAVVQHPRNGQKLVPGEKANFQELRGPRRVGDQYCWILSFVTSHEISAGEPSSNRSYRLP